MSNHPSRSRAAAMARRKRILGALSRPSLEMLSGYDNPRVLGNADLIELAAGRWDREAVETEIMELIGRAS